MIKLNTSWSYAISKLNLINSVYNTDNLLKSLVVINEPTVLGFLNAHGFNYLVEKPLFFESIKCMDIILRDGVGVEMLLRMQGKDPGENMNGTDFIPILLEQYHNKKIAIIATKSPYLEATSKILEEHYSIEVIIAEDGFQSDDCYLSKLTGRPVDIILLGMGMPKQERVARKLKNKLDYPVLIVCGGAIVDFIAGRFTRAPEWVRKIGMEWFYRFLNEPQRLFKRYIFGNVKFILRALYCSIISSK